MQYPNWFMPYAEPLFERYLLPLAGKPGLRFLQIGAFTGDASLWMLRNVITGPDSTLTDVDTWKGSDEPEHRLLDWADIEDLYDARMRGFAHRGKLVKFKGASEEFFKTEQPPFDFIYIDGDHDPHVVYADGYAALGLSAPGSLLAFDDYEWVPRSGGPGPGDAIRDLVKLTGLSQWSALELNAQAWFLR